MEPPRQVRCGPVVLRMITPRMSHQLFALARDPEVSRQLQWQAHGSVDVSLEYVHDTRALWQRRAAWLPGIFDAEREQLVGCTGLSSIDRVNLRAEVGTWIGAAFQGRGYNRPSKAAVAVFAFDVLGLERLEFLVRADNERSLRAMRALPAVVEEGVLRARLHSDGEAHDAVLFALLRREFEPQAWPAVELGPGSGR